MQAYYEIETEIPLNHQLNLQLPANIPVGKAKITVIYELAGTPLPKNTLMMDFLASLPDNPSDGLSREEIQSYIDQERESWDN
jgi:hypothetical protein